VATTNSREIRFVTRPRGWPKPADFECVYATVPEPEQGEVLVKNLYMSVDPYARERLSDTRDYFDAFQVGRALEGLAVGRVLQSCSSEFSAGDMVSSMCGWREYFVARTTELRRVDSAIEPLSAHLGVLGTSGLTAWAGLNLVNVQAPDRLFISDAASAMGRVAGQLAKLRGCWVVGSVASLRDVSALLALGFDAVFNHRDGDLPGQLKAAAPDGIDVYFDTVGGGHLEAALGMLRPEGRVIACSNVAPGREASWRGPRNFAPIISKRLVVRGYVVADLLNLAPAFMADVGKHFRDGKLRMNEVVVDGLENAPGAFIDLLQEGNTGIKVVRFA
jgi:NADPH-dependent curcumin reductase CurA